MSVLSWSGQDEIGCGSHIRPHYAPMISAEAADEQVRRWWNETHVGAAVAEGLVVVVEAVGQRGRSGAVHVVYKLYVYPRHRGCGLGPQLLEALTRQLPADADRLYIEHFVANERVGAFYEREGFTVERIEAGPAENPALGGGLACPRAGSLRRGVKTSVTPGSPPVCGSAHRAVWGSVPRLLTRPDVTVDYV